jgi:hypothetical protein
MNPALNRIALAFLLIALSLSAGCTSPLPEPCSRNLTPSIIPGKDAYALILSSSPGLPLSPDPGQGASSSCLYRYRWLATDGTFLSWREPDFIVREIGNETVTDNSTIYWTWRDPGLPASGQDVRITLEVRDPGGTTVLGSTTLSIGWEGETAVVRKNGG